MRRSLRSIVLVLAFCVTVLYAMTAVAAPTTWERLDITLHAEESGGVLLVSGVLPQSVSLPASAELALPAGAKLSWLGEILGGPPSEDPELAQVKSSSKGLDVYRFTLSNAHTAQAEIATSTAQLFDGTTYTSSILWTAGQAVPEVRLSVRVPDGANAVAPGADLVRKPGDSGYSFYTKTVKNVKAGDELDLKLAYTLSAAPAAVAGTGAGAASSDTDSTALMVFVGIIAVAFGAILFARRKTAPASPAEEEHPADDDERLPAATDGATPPTRSRGTAKRNLVTIGVIGVLIIGTAIVGRQSTKPKLMGDTITEVFAQGEPCVTATIPLSVPSGADPADTANTVFTALRPLANTATFNAKTSTVQVGFCESKSSETAVRAALQPTGLLGQGPAQ